MTLPTQLLGLCRLRNSHALRMPSTGRWGRGGHIGAYAQCPVPSRAPMVSYTDPREQVTQPEE